MDHTVLLQKLCKYGFDADVLNQFMDYLSNHTQCCMVNEVTSDTCDVICGIPQGSILSPLLFIIYIIDQRDVLEFSM